MFSVDFLDLVVIVGFQCAKPGHVPDFLKTRPDRTCLGNPDVW